MPLRLSFQLALQLLLCRNLDDLVVDDTVSKRHIGQEPEQVSGNMVAVHRNWQIRLNYGRHINDIHIDQGE